jgi:hypothetical protein
MADLYRWVADAFERAADDICRLFEGLLAGVMAVTAILVSLITAATFFG